MKAIFISMLFCLSFTTLYSQQQKVDKTFFTGQWKGMFSEQPVTIEFLDDSISVWTTDNNGFFPGGLLLRFTIDLSVYPYKVEFHNSDSTNIPLHNLLATIEVMNSDTIKFVGEKVILSNGEEQIPKGTEGIIELSRIVQK